ncbi:MAG TPA: CusA/CzcA family heavy metal efflux RND transporter, partial [Gammaproteobacteria bacterium]|nr:CusA/CzcA family heavy metal efflux RND transporter [Gammaproteobacteria bacterium]
VIIVENCLRRLSQESEERGALNLKERMQTVFESTAEVIRPSLFGVFIIMAVYLPIFALEGVEGKMFHPMAQTVVMALAAALFLSVTFVPAGVALLFRGPVREKHNRVMEAARKGYEPLLRWALNARVALLAAAVVLVLACGWLATRLGSEFVPSLNEGDIAVQALRIPATGLSQSVAFQ